MLKIVTFLVAALVSSVASADGTVTSMMGAAAIIATSDSPIRKEKLRGPGTLIDKITKVEGKCMDAATERRFRTEAVDDTMVRQNIAATMPDIGEKTILDAQLKRGFTCWYIEARVAK